MPGSFSSVPKRYSGDTLSVATCDVIGAVQTADDSGRQKYLMH